MQFLKVAHELITDINISANEFRIYTYLMSLYNKEKACSYPSITVISKRTGISERTVSTSIKNLVKNGYMTISKKKGINGNYNQYNNFIFLIENKKKIHEYNILSNCKKEMVFSHNKDNKLASTLFNSSTNTDNEKVSLILKHNITLTNKQMYIVSYMDMDILILSLKNFKRRKGQYFNFLLELYIDLCLKNDKHIDMNIERYRKEKIHKSTQTQLENLETKQALIELNIYNEKEWINNLMLGL